jgi:hypothetical protein
MPEKWESSGREIDREAVQSDPAPYPDSDRSDLGLDPVPIGPDADPPGRPPSLDPEPAESRDHPSFESVDESPDVAAAPLEVERT